MTAKEMKPYFKSDKANISNDSKKTEKKQHWALKVADRIKKEVQEYKKMSDLNRLSKLI